MPLLLCVALIIIIIVTQCYKHLIDHNVIHLGLHKILVLWATQWEAYEETVFLWYCVMTAFNTVVIQEKDPKRQSTTIHCACSH